MDTARKHNCFELSQWIHRLTDNHLHGLGTLQMTAYLFHAAAMGNFSVTSMFFVGCFRLFLSPAVARWKCFRTVCLFVCLCLYHDVCPDDLTLKDWCHTNNILQVHCWGCLFVQVMFHALMTSSMTSLGHKVGQILKLIYLRQYLS